MNAESSKELLLESLRRQSDSFLESMQEIENAMSNSKFRVAFLLIGNLKENGLWKPTEIDEHNLEEFWWDFAN